MSKGGSAGARSRARILTVQALYQQQITAHPLSELLAQFRERREYATVDQDYFEDSLEAICSNRDALMQRIDALADRPIAQLDPVELAILLLGFHELEAREDIPFRVVINEAIILSKKFGAVDGHKYINALLDRAAADLRSTEHK
jgi:N utilization substance protein B